jgi:glycerol-3-phosphate dehydrogenase (NAD(P)+)
MKRVGVAGAGTWGTALAQVAASAGNAVVLWGRNPEQMALVAAEGRNERHLPGIALSPKIEATAERAALAACDLLLLVVPAQATRENLAALKPHLGRAAALVLCAKGIEAETLLLQSELAAEVLPGQQLAVLSGPTFAGEVARGLPTAVCLAAEDLGLAEELTGRLGTRSFRPYASGDPLGAQVGGAVKNVIAIACGIVEGLALGENARAALITRGLAEVTRLAVAKGGQAATLMGLSGLGDLTLSCNTAQSRNFALGRALARGEARPENLTEGFYTAPAVVALAGRLGVEMPICAAVTSVLHQGAELAPQIERLLSRPFRSE